MDVAAIGFGKKEKLIKNRADKDDFVVLIGGSTGRDGIGGSQFASDKLESENRSAVQIPDPFIEKLVIEVILEARDQHCIKAMKDLGGGGLSCAISEIADALLCGKEKDVARIQKKESKIAPTELMVSESQERMLVITDRQKLPFLKKICEKFKVPYSVIGKVKDDRMMQVRVETNTIANLPSSVIVNAPLLDRPASKPKYMRKITEIKKPNTPKDLTATLLHMLTNPNIASRIWVYGQYDHEVGIRTVVKPGHDASVLRLDNGKFLSVKIDGNSKHCYIDPRQGAMGCFEEACRNVVCTGAAPIGMVDHLQFGNPEDPEIFWTFKESLEGISEFAKQLEIPCVGGKVSFYNETNTGPIKPTPLIGVLGLIDEKPIQRKVTKNDLLVIIGETKDELGGSEYYEYIHDIIGGNCPTVDMKSSKLNQKIVLDLINLGLVNCAHDCSKGGIGVAVSEICMINDVGCVVSIDKIPTQKLKPDEILFSESHSRYLLAIDPKNTNKTKSLLEQNKIPFAIIGKFSGTGIVFRNKAKTIVNLRIDKALEKWLNSLGLLITHG